MPVFDCPNRTTTSRELAVISTCCMIEQGVLPDPGGWEDQAHSLVRAYPVVMNEVRLWREEARKQARKAAEQAARQKQRSG